MKNSEKIYTNLVEIEQNLSGNAIEAINNSINYQALPVYAQKQRILDTLAQNQVIVVQSPTGSGKTTQIQKYRKGKRTLHEFACPAI